MNRDSQLILIVDDESSLRRVLSAMLEQAGHATLSAASGEEALALVRAQDPQLVIADLQMPGMDGLALLGRLRADYPEIPVVLLTAHGTVETAVTAMKQGALDFLSKPFDKQEVLSCIDKALGQAERSRREFQGPLIDGARCGIVGTSPAMSQLCTLIEKVAATPATVLVTGETGTGKELVAAALHALSDRSDAPFVKVNCGALPENLVESELFGHEKGAFTGAETRKPGRFELADGGLLFLDEIGELPPAAQVKLLRVVQDGQLDLVGGTAPVVVDVRLVVATNRNLEAEVEAGRFREDLLYRLKVVEIEVPPLRERAGDLPELVDCFLDKHAGRLGRPRPELSEAALAALEARPWKGNVRELEHAVERAVLLADGPELGPEDFGPSGAAARKADGAAGQPTLKEASRAAAAETESRLIRQALDATDGNVTKAAEELGLSRRGLQMKMKELDLR